jgi:peptidoglycan hydrolase-like protein with peptidoglycan-binding domain
VSAALSTLLVAAPFLDAASAATKPAPTSAVTGSTARPATAATAVPVTPTGLPADIEDLAPYVGQVSCDPNAKVGTLALARILTTTYPGTGYVVERACGTEPVASEHVDGRAVDWTVSARSTTQKAQAEAFLAWLLATDGAGRPFAAARRLGVMYVIWNDRIWSSHDPMPGWQPYSTCATHPETTADAVCHRSRLHVSLSWAGAMQRTSYWTRTVAPVDYGPCRPSDLNWAPAYTNRNATACPTYPAVTALAGANATVVSLVQYSGATVGPGDSGPAVTAVQKGLGVPADGAYGHYTADAVAAFQTKHGLAGSGAMDAASWRALLVATGARTLVQATPAPVKVPASTLTKYKKVVLRYGSRGDAVMALQRRLGVTVSGWFGPKTRVAVVAFQQSAKLRATGIVDTATWTALGA